MGFPALSRSRRIMVLLLALMPFWLYGCNPVQPGGEEPRKEYIDSVMAILTQVQKNLSDIKRKEAVVERLSTDIEQQGAKTPQELGKDIYSSIRFIDSTLEASRNLVARLEKENRESLYRVESVDQLTAELRRTIEAKELEIRQLKSEVQMLDEQVSELLETVDVLDEFILEQEDKLSYAYYISGTYDELVKKGVLESTSTPLASMFGRQYRLSGDADLSAFRQIDIMEIRDLFFEQPVRMLRIITPHTAGSYEMVGGESSTLLLIRDENEFWRKSRCLVVITEK